MGDVTAPAPSGSPTPPRGGSLSFKWLVLGILIMLTLRGGAQAWIEANVKRAVVGVGHAGKGIGEGTTVAPVDTASETAEQRTAREEAERKAAQEFGEGTSEAFKGGFNALVGYLVLAPFAYFLGALLVGWKSTGRTILEPALSAIVVVIVMTAYNVVRTGSDGSLEATAICSSIGCFMIALVGALIGEKIQSAAG